MLDRGIEREILVVAHDAELWLINFLGKNQQNMTPFFTYGLFCYKLLFLGIIWLSDFIF
jgi:hypothetical protein